MSNFRTPARRHIASSFDTPLGAVYLVAFTLLLTACPGPNTYGTARTLAPGQVQVTVAAEAIADDDTSEGEVTSLLLPTVGARVGLSEGLDLGLRMHNLAAPGADLKIALTQGVVDIALDPSVVFSWVPPIGGVYGHLPLMITGNLAEQFSLTAVPGISYGVGLFPTVFSDNTEDDFITLATGPLARLGLGLQLKPSNRVAIAPEITMLAPLTETDRSTLFYGGIGLHWLTGTTPE